MHPALTAILIVLILVVLFIICLAFIPVDISVILEKSGDIVWKTFSAAWGAVGGEFFENELKESRFLLFGSTIYRSVSKKTPSTTPKKRGGRMGFEEATQMFRDLNELQPHFLSLLRIFTKSFSVRRMRCRLRLGFPDPTTTGLVYGYFSAVKAVLGPTSRFDLGFDPVFDREVADGRFEASFRIDHPIRPIISIAGLAVKKPMRRMMRTISAFR